MPEVLIPGPAGTAHLYIDDPIRPTPSPYELPDEDKIANWEAVGEIVNLRSLFETFCNSHSVGDVEIPIIVKDRLHARENGWELKVEAELDLQSQDVFLDWDELLHPHTVQGTATHVKGGQYNVVLPLYKAGNWQIFFTLCSTTKAQNQYMLLKGTCELMIRTHSCSVAIGNTQFKFDGDRSRNFCAAAVAGRVGYFLVIFRDKYRNTTPLTPKEDRLLCVSENKHLRILRTYNHARGVYRVTYYTEKAGQFPIAVLLASQRKHNACTVPNSPLIITVFPDFPCKQYCSMTPPIKYHAGQDESYVVGIFDRFQNAVTDAILALRTDTKCLAYNGITNLNDEGRPGYYSISFSTNKCYKYICKTYVIGNANIEYDDAPYELPVYILTPLPASLTVTNCFSEHRQLTGKAGVEGKITVHKRDKFNNAINADIFTRTESDDIFTIQCDDPELKIFAATTSDSSTFTISYHTVVARTYLLHLLLGDQMLEGGPFSLVINPQHPDATYSYIETPVGPSLAGQPGIFSIVLRDMYGNLTSSHSPEDSHDDTFNQSFGTTKQSDTSKPNQIMLGSSPYTKQNLLIPDDFQNKWLPRCQFTQDKAPLPLSYAESQPVADLDESMITLSAHGYDSSKHGSHLPNVQLLKLIGSALSTESSPKAKQDSFVLWMDFSQETDERWLKFDFGSKPQGFQKCCVTTHGSERCAAMWTVEYSDNNHIWDSLACTLLSSGDSTVEWEYCGDHRYWRLLCGTSMDHLVADLSKPRKTGITQVEWWVPCFGKAYAHYTKQRAKAYEITMKINSNDGERDQQKTEAPIPLWVNNHTHPSKCTVELPDVDTSLVVRDVMTLLINLKDKYGHNRLVGTQDELDMIAVCITAPNSAKMNCQIEDSKAGAYTVSFDGRLAGTYQLEVHFGQDKIPCPKTFMMLPGPTDPTKCQPLPLDRTIVTRDNCFDCPDVSTVYSKQLANESFCASCFEKRCKKIIQSADDTDEARSAVQEQVVQIQHEAVPLDLDGLTGGIVGRTSKFHILARDAYNNACTQGVDEFIVKLKPKSDGGSTPPSPRVTTFTTGAGTATTPVAGATVDDGTSTDPGDDNESVRDTTQDSTVPATVEYEKDGYYLVSYKLTKACTYELHVYLVNRVKTEHKDSTITKQRTRMFSTEFEMSATTVHPNSCQLLSNSHVGAGKNIQAGHPISMSIAVCDEFGNALPFSDEKTLRGWFFTPAQKAAKERKEKEAKEKLRKEKEEQELVNQPILVPAVTTATPNKDKSGREKDKNNDQQPQPDEQEVDKTKVWVPKQHDPSIKVEAATMTGQGVYNAVCHAYTVGQYVLNLEYDSTIVFTYTFTVVPAAVQAARCKVISLSPELAQCTECDVYTAMYYCKLCVQCFCDKCWKHRHGNRCRQHHSRSVLGVDDKSRRAGDIVTFGILTHDSFDNLVVIPETSHTTIEAILEYRELILDPKASKVKGKGKKQAPIPISIRRAGDGMTVTMDLSVTESVISLKRKLQELWSIHQSIQRLSLNGKIMEDNKALQDYSVLKNTIIDLDLQEAEVTEVVADIGNIGKGLWKVEFQLQGAGGTYVLQLKIGTGATVKNAYTFDFQAYMEEPKSRAAQLRLIEDMKRQVNELQIKLGWLQPDIVVQDGNGNVVDSGNHNNTPNYNTDEEGYTSGYSTGGGDEGLSANELSADEGDVSASDVEVEEAEGKEATDTNEQVTQQQSQSEQQEHKGNEDTTDGKDPTEGVTSIGDKDEGTREREESRTSKDTRSNESTREEDIKSSTTTKEAESKTQSEEESSKNA